MATKPTLPPSIWAENRPTLPPTTDSQWGQGFEYTSTTSGGKALTETFDYPLFKIDESLRWLRDLFDSDGNLTGLTKATTAQAEAFTDDEAYLTSLKGSQLVDSKFSDNSLTENGYQVLPGGLIIQWGIAGSESIASITFPITFPSKLCSLTFGDLNDNAQGGETCATSEIGGGNGSTPTNKGFELVKYVGTSFATHRVYWFAIGY